MDHRTWWLDVTPGSGGGTILLVRHADIDLPPSSPDPPLNAAGRHRAVRLAHAVGSTSPASIFTSALRRTKQTAAPIAAQVGIQPQEAPPLDALVRQLTSARSGGTTLIVGHSNTVPQIVVELGAVPAPPTIGEREFDHLYVVTLHPGDTPRLVHLRYGEPARLSRLAGQP